MNREIRILLRSKLFLIILSLLISISLSLFVKSLNDMDQNFERASLGDGFGEISLSIYADHLDS